MRQLLTFFALCTLTACSTSIPTQYFTLPDSQYTVPPQHTVEMPVRVILADPIGNGGLVYQTDVNRINFARNHLWAMPLDDALAASFSNKLNQLNPSYAFVPASRSNKNTPLKIYIESFQGSHLGQVNVHGYAVWPNGESRNFNIDVPQKTDGYTAMVEALGNGISQAAKEISY